MMDLFTKESSTVLFFLKHLLSGLEKSISTQALGQLTIDLYMTFWKHASFSILATLTTIGSHQMDAYRRCFTLLATHPCWLKCPRGASNVSVCSIFRPVLCLHYVRYAGTSQYQYDVLRLWKTSLEDGWMERHLLHPEFESHGDFGHDPCISCWAPPSGTTKNIPCAVFSCYATLHPLYILMSYVSELFDGILLSWFFVHSGSYPTKPLYRKMAYLWLTTQVSCSQGIFFQVFACFLWTHEFSLIKTLQVWIRGGVPTETQ